MGGMRLNALAGKAMQFAAGQSEQVGWRLGIAAGNDDMEVRMAAGQYSSGGFGLGERVDGSSCQHTQLRPVRGNPINLGQEALVECLEAISGVQFPART